MSRYTDKESLEWLLGALERNLEWFEGYQASLIASRSKVKLPLGILGAAKETIQDLVYMLSDDTKELTIRDKKVKKLNDK